MNSGFDRTRRVIRRPHYSSQFSSNLLSVVTCYSANLSIRIGPKGARSIDPGFPASVDERSNRKHGFARIMIKVTALTSGRNVPSSRFRVRQFIEPLSHFGIQVSEYPLRLRKYTPNISAPIRFLVDACKTVARVPGLLAARTSDITWLERELVPRRLTLEHWAGSKRLFDVDDALWLTGDSAFSEEIAIKSYGVVAGNEFLAEHYRSAGARAWVVPTSIDTDRWQPLPKPQDKTWVVGWTGTSSNLPCLESLEEPLADFLAQHPETKLVVVCDRTPSFKRISP